MIHDLHISISILCLWRMGRPTFCTTGHPFRDALKKLKKTGHPLVLLLTVQVLASPQWNAKNHELNLGDIMQSERNPDIQSWAKVNMFCKTVFQLKSVTFEVSGFWQVGNVNRLETYHSHSASSTCLGWILHTQKLWLTVISLPTWHDDPPWDLDVPYDHVAIFFKSLLALQCFTFFMVSWCLPSGKPARKYRKPPCC